ncbi:Replication protein O [Paenibacillus macerans]|uniref:Replication protein O n=1 Tax=Paenibacillus macerans TaxID=44252 RepID=UPI00204229B5|nr:Replication protein O [Paenibacillus macerans]MCM3701876.1 Replication protein O [Paenibacillus macerans]
MDGWIKLHRKIQDHWIYQEKRKFSRYEAWLDMIMMANHKNNKFLHGNELVEVERGQFITSELKLMERWDWGKNKLRLFLDLLEKDGMIIKKTDRKRTAITICNYGLYHDSESENGPQPDHERTNRGPSADTNKNEKNDKNDEEDEKPSPPKNPKRIYSEDELYYRLAKRFHELAYKNAQDNGTAHLIKEPNFQSWADTFRLMFEKDGVKENEIGNVVKYALSDHFYQTIIFSPKNLRKHYRAILTKMNTGGGGHGGNKGNNGGSASKGGTPEKRGKDRFRGTVAREVAEAINNFE